MELIPFLDRDLLQFLRDLGNLEGSRDSRFQTLISLLPALKGKQFLETLKEALEIATAILTESGLGWGLLEVIPYLDSASKQQTMEKARELVGAMQDESSRSSALIELLPCLQGESRQSAAKAALKIAMEVKDTPALVDLLPYLQGVSRARAVAVVLRTSANMHWFAINKMQDLVPYLHAMQKQKFLRRELKRLLAEKDNVSLHDDLVEHLARHLSEELLGEAIDVVETMHEAYCAAWLERLASFFHERQLQRVLQIAGRMRADHCCSVLWACCPYLTDAQLGEALEIACGIDDDGYRGIVFKQIARFSSDALIDRVLNASLQLKDSWALAIALAPLIARAQLQAQILLEKALAEARKAPGGHRRAEALTPLIPYVDAGAKVDLVAETIQECLTIESETDLIESLTEVGAVVPESLLQGVLDASHSIRTKSERAKFLKQLARSKAASGMSLQGLYNVWRETIWTLAGSTREELLHDILNLLPLITALGSSGAELAREIHDTQRRWP